MHPLRKKLTDIVFDYADRHDCSVKGILQRAGVTADYFKPRYQRLHGHQAPKYDVVRALLEECGADIGDFYGGPLP